MVVMPFDLLDRELRDREIRTVHPDERDVGSVKRRDERQLARGPPSFAALAAQRWNAGSRSGRAAGRVRSNPRLPPCAMPAQGSTAGNEKADTARLPLRGSECAGCLDQAGLGLRKR